MIIPGIDGRKMSKSYNNYIDPFDTEKKLRKTINRIVTNSAGVKDPKDPSTCNVFQLYSLFATDAEKVEMVEKYQNGIMYSEAKTALFEKIMDEFKTSREEYDRIISDKTYLDFVLNVGKEKASEIASRKMKMVKNILGF